MAQPQASTNEALAPIPEQHCVTAMSKSTFKYTWTISDFRSMLRTFPHNQKLDSPIFSDPENNFKFRLQISPKGHEDDYGYDGYVAMFLKSENECNVFAGFSTYILNSLGQPTNTTTSKIANISTRSSVGLDHYVLVSTLTSNADLLPGGNLTISCEVTVLNAVHNVEEIISAKDTSAGAVLQDVNTLMFESMKFSDVILKVQDKEFPAHKIFLASRSEVFAAMLEHNMEESQLNVVVIKDMEPETFQELLRFVYTGKVCNMKEVALELLVAADKYALHCLKTMCEHSLITSLSVQNACELLQIAYLHSANSIKVHTTKFIHKNARKVFETNSWKTLILNHPKLVSELYSSLATQV